MKDSKAVILVSALIFVSGLLGISARYASAGKPVAAKAVKPHLLGFGASWCNPCRRMEPLIEKLEKEEGLRLERYDVSTSTGAAEMDRWKERLGSSCAGIPFYVNTRSSGTICGAVEYIEFRNWALQK